MTKRIIGLILAIAAIAVIVIAAIRHNTYTSMIEPAATEMPAPEKTGQKNRRRNLCGPIRSLRPNPTRYGKRAAMQGRNSNRKQSYDRNIPVRRQRPNARVRTCDPISARSTRKELRSNPESKSPAQIGCAGDFDSKDSLFQ